MPYVSHAQRRFFHSKGALKAGITPQQVKEYDEASKGLDLPEHVKKSHLMLRWMEKVCNVSQGIMGGLKAVGPTAKPLATAKPNTPKLNPAINPNPSEYKPSFLSNSGAAAQRGSNDKLTSGESLTMPT